MSEPTVPRMPRGAMIRQAVGVLAATVAAFLFAALTPVAISFPFDDGPAIMPEILAVALGFTFVFALPAFLVVRAWGRVGLRNCLIAGASIGGIPVAVLAGLNLLTLDNESDGGVPWVIDHVPTVQGWEHYALFVGEAAAMGVASSFVFWLVLAACRALPAINRDYAVMPRIVPTIGLLAAAFGLCALVWALPTLTMDRSCHAVVGKDGKLVPRPAMAACDVSKP